MPQTLIYTANNYQVYKCQIAAALAGQDLKVEEVKTVHDKLPLAKAPVLDTGNGLVFQSNAIIRHFARSAPASLAYGESVLDMAQVDQWIDYCLNEFEPARGVWLFPVLKMMDLNMRSYNMAKKDITKQLKIMDKHLSRNTYFVGHSPTLADVAIFSALLDMFSTLFAPNYIKNFVNVIRWFNTCAHLPAFAGVVGEVTFATEEQKATLPKKKDNKKAGKKGNKQPQQAKKPKAPKKVHPLAALPKSSMNMDATKKKFFTQKPFNPAFFNDFWQNYDEKGYCFYTMDYQYNDDNVEFWKTQNQVGMYVQRLRAGAKWAFGNVSVNGSSEETGPWVVQGCFLFRGDAIPQEILDVPDTEYYKWTKVDTSTDAGKATVVAHMQGDKVGDLTVLDRRYFK